MALDYKDLLIRKLELAVENLIHERDILQEKIGMLSCGPATVNRDLQRAYTEANSNWRITLDSLKSANKRIEALEFMVADLNKQNDALRSENLFLIQSPSHDSRKRHLELEMEVKRLREANRES
jgi:hypothetical protein